MKKFLLFLLALILSVSAASISFAQNSAKSASAQNGSSAMALVWISPSAVSDITKSENILAEGLKKGLEQHHFVFKDQADSQTLMQEYMIENSLVPDDTEDSVGFLPKKADMKAMAEQADVKYVAFINARITDEKIKTAWLGLAPNKFEVTTLFTTIVYSLDANKYVYFKQISVKENAAGSSSSERAFEKSCATFIRKHISEGKLVFKDNESAATTAAAKK